MTNIVSVIFTVLLLFTNTLYAQDEPLATKRVFTALLPIEVSNTVAGTQLDSYVVQLKKGQELHVQIENKTDRSRVYFDIVLAGTETRFGSDSSENSWSGVAPKTGDYEIRLVAYPSANYKLLAYVTGIREDESKVAFDHSLKLRSSARAKPRPSPRALGYPVTTDKSRLRLPLGP